MKLLESIRDLLKEDNFNVWDNPENTKGLVFEDDRLLGLVYIFEDSQQLINNWKSVESSSLRKFSNRFREAGDKTWNIYSIFITEDGGNEEQINELKVIEEDFTATRKIARCDIKTRQDLENALLPVLTIRYPVHLDPVEYETDLVEKIRLSNNSVKLMFDKYTKPQAFLNSVLEENED